MKRLLLFALLVSGCDGGYGSDYPSCARQLAQRARTPVAARAMASGYRIYYGEGGNKAFARCLMDGLRNVDNDTAARIVINSCRSTHGVEAPSPVPRRR